MEASTAGSGQNAPLPAGVVISSKGRRLGAALLEVPLAIITLGIGYLIWSLIVYKNAQTPGKQVLGMRIVDSRTGQATSWGMTFLREFIVEGIIGSITFGIAYLWILWDKNNQALYDKLLNTIVVDDKDGATLARSSG
jgi:uncharacterized RDD family membrane protein YckC